MLSILPSELLLIIISFLNISSLASFINISKFYSKCKIVSRNLIMHQADPSIPPSFTITLTAQQLNTKSSSDYIDYTNFTNLTKQQLKETVFDLILNDAIFNGYTELFDLFTKPLTPDGQLNYPRIYTSQYCEKAAYVGNLDILKLFHKNHSLDIFTSNILNKAAQGGNLKVIKWLLTLGDECHSHYTYHTCCEAFSTAARNGHLEILKQTISLILRIGDKRYNEHFFNSAAEFGDIAVLEWLRIELCGENGTCTWNESACQAAASKGHYDVVKWLHTNGSPSTWRIDWQTFNYVVDRPPRDGQLEMLQWLRDNNYPWTAAACTAAVRHENFEVLKWLRSAPNEEDRCPWCSDACSSAARHGYFEILKWLRHNGCSWNEQTFSSAVCGGDWEILKWLKHNGCPWDVKSYLMASYSKRIDILIWLKKGGCPWDESVTKTVTTYLNFDILEWLIRNGCPYNNSVLTMAVDNGCTAIHKWIEERQY